MTTTRSQNIFKTAWSLVKGFKSTFWLAMLYAFGLLLFLFAVTYPIHLFGVAVNIPNPTYFLIGLIISYFILPAGLGIFLLALKHAKGEPLKAKSVFQYYRLPIMGQVFLVTLLLLILMVLLFLIPSWIFRGILIFVMSCVATIWTMSAMLIAERSLSFAVALKKSTTAVARHAFKIIGIYLAIGVLTFIGFATALIGFIWIAPWIVNLIVVLYQSFFAESH